MLPDVDFVMLSASRIGTPAPSSVPSVRALRDTIFFSTNCPKMITFRTKRSHPNRPAGIFLIPLIIRLKPNGTAGIAHQ